jgi:hypothetical protein
MSRLLLRSIFVMLGLMVLIPIVPHISARAQPSQRCFPETSFCIAGRIREFWEENGGLPVFGFPIGPEQEELIEGRPFQVQWFERNRLELHPENARPYDVLLGRLGADRLSQQGRDWYAFPKSEPQPGCRFFAETGHNICGAILASWRANGLEFDRRQGKSEAENLALFGLPLSDAQTETIEGKEYLVQWFERARFEVHPENQPPFHVLLGLLGNEMRPSTKRWITSVAEGDRVAQTITLIGTYPANLADDLWVLILPPNERYYPQSLNACNRERTPKINGRWEMRVGFGGPNNVGEPFRIVLTTANAQASQVILDTLSAWCQANNFPGLEQLPPGLTILEQITVTRTAEKSGLAPALSNTTLPGQIAITNPIDNAQVPQSLTVMGTYAPEVTNDIWVLLYALNGRWYPQSSDACSGMHTQKADGQWQVQAYFGGAGNVSEPFDIVVVLADQRASAALDAKQRQWCAENNYPGWLTIELPEGLAEKSRIRVVRK